MVQHMCCNSGSSSSGSSKLLNSNPLRANWPRSTSSILYRCCGVFYWPLWAMSMRVWLDMCVHTCMRANVRASMRSCVRWLSIFIRPSNQCACAFTLDSTLNTHVYDSNRCLLFIVNVQLWFAVRNYLTINFWTPISTPIKYTEIKWLRSNVSIHVESQCHLHKNIHTQIDCNCIALH